MIAISESLRQEIAQLKAENARLQNELSRAQSAPINRADLNDLLAPTLELLYKLPMWDFLGPSRWKYAVESEIARLRTLIKD